MVCSNLNKSRENSSIEAKMVVITKAIPINKTIEGGFAEGTIYVFRGQDYDLNDLPDFVVGYSSFMIESYLKSRENDNQR